MVRQAGGPIRNATAARNRRNFQGRTYQESSTPKTRLNAAIDWLTAELDAATPDELAAAITLIAGLADQLNTTRIEAGRTHRRDTRS